MTATLRTTPLHDRHVALGAKLVPFAGWEMPIQYDGVIAEHKAVRSSCGIFDVSHMGVFAVSGNGADAALQQAMSNDIERLSDGMAQYTLLTNERGGIEDDLIVYRHRADLYTLVVNAANREHDLAWLQQQMPDGVLVEDHSADWSIIAVQGPKAPAVLGTIGIDIDGWKPFRWANVDANGTEVFVGTTGYTGEPGAELIVANADAGAIWDLLAADDRVTPCGLGCRDTLRLEKCYPLHGNDIDADTTAVEAALGWTVGWDTQFTGAEALKGQRDSGAQRILTPFRMTERGIPRQGCNVLNEQGDVIGQVTSGTMSPSLGEGIGMAYLPAGLPPSSPIVIDIRGRNRAAATSDRPLYK